MWTAVLAQYAFADLVRDRKPLATILFVPRAGA